MLKQMHPFQSLRMQILLSPVKFPPEFVTPRPVGIKPSLNRVFAIADLGNSERTGPHIVAAGSHRSLLPRFGARHAPLQHRRDHIVPILEDVGRDLHRIADQAFDCVATAIEQGLQTFNDDRGLFHALNLRAAARTGPDSGCHKGSLSQSAARRSEATGMCRKKGVLPLTKPKNP